MAASQGQCDANNKKGVYEVPALTRSSAAASAPIFLTLTSGGIAIESSPSSSSASAEYIFRFSSG